jgi:FkbM family methyltransferase
MGIDFKAKNFPSKVVLFGAGDGGKEAIGILDEYDIDVTEVFDNDKNKIGRFLIRDIKITKPHKTSSLVLIASIYAYEIATQLRELGCSYMYFGPCFERNDYFKKIDKSNYNWLTDHIADDKSKKILTDLHEFRKTADPLYIPRSDYEIYDHPCVHAKKGFHIIDGGAWIGDTAQFFYKKTGGDCFIHCFEPSKVSLEQIEIPNVRKIQKGLYDKDATMNFVENQKSGSQNFIMPFSEENQNNETISVIRLDSYRKHIKTKIDMIKLDIEGAEISAIRGGTELLKTDQPDLIIALYHKYNDLWEIPKLINEVNPEYRFFLGHHSQYCFDTILYATVRNDCQ